jgi:hypothetical protein
VPARTRPPIPKLAIARLWEALCRDGDTLRHDGQVLYFTYALLQRAVAGIGFEPEPFRLIFTDRFEAERTFVEGTPDVPGSRARWPCEGRPWQCGWRRERTSPF